MTPTTFRFLDLPKELRLMVYERISLETHRYLVKHLSVTKAPPNMTYHEYIAEDTGPAMQVISKTLDVALLATCSRLYLEAKPFLSPKLQELMMEPMRLFMDYAIFVADHEDTDSVKTGFPMLKSLLHRCQSVAARLQTPQQSQQSYQVEIALTGDNERIPGDIMMQAFFGLYGAAQVYGVNVAVFCQGPLRDVTVQVPGMPPPVTSPWQQVWDMGKQMLLERDHNRAVETVMELKGLEEGEWAKFLADWEAL